MKVLNVGIIGYGLAGSVFHTPIIRTINNFRIKKIVSSQNEKIESDFPGMEVCRVTDELFNDAEIDLAVITSPNTSHYDLAKKALNSGKHVVVEKPFVINSKEGQELIVLAKKKNLVLTVFHNRRWDGDFLTIKRCIEAGELGEVYYFESHFDRFRPIVDCNRWREKDEPGSGILYDLGPHLIDQALVLFGKPKSIFADVASQRCEAKADDYFHIILNYDKLRVILHAAAVVKANERRFIIHGDKGSLIKNGLDTQEDSLKKGLNPLSNGWGVDLDANYAEVIIDVNALTSRERIQTLKGSYEVFYKNLAEAILDKKEPPVKAEEALYIIKLIELALKSSQKGKVITL